MKTSSPGTVRDHLIRALEADLVGPFDPGGDEHEVLRLPPSRWYLTGYLAPETGREVTDPQDDEMGGGSDQSELEAPPAEGESKRRNRHPASLGLSVLLPPGESAETVRATVSFAEYRAESQEAEHDDGPRTVWRREPCDPVSVDLRLDASALERGVELPGFEKVVLIGQLAVDDGQVPGTRVLALFLVNRREPGPKGRKDERFLFQVSMEVEFERGILARPNRKDERSDDWDDRIADLQYRDRCEYAVGHGTAVEVCPANGEGRVTRVRTTWLPRAEVRRVVTRDEPDVVTLMDELGALADGAAAGRALRPLVAAYQAWIEEQETSETDSDERRATLRTLAGNARLGSRRILEGIELLERDEQALEAFRVANEAMATVRRNKGDEQPSWRLFQLAFVLLNLPSVTDARHKYREVVELIFFPTGGGKTEAYLGVIGYVLVLRRLRGRERPDGGLGVAVILRYTLRLLTLDQLGRAASLICALEMLRRRRGRDSPRGDLGASRFTIGLWVGRSATANTMSDVSQKIRDHKTKGYASPFPLTDCPWCGRELEGKNMELRPNATRPTEVAVGCHYTCDFALSKTREGLPVLFVDEQVYRELPSFLLATVDKFAMLPWRGETGKLFGRVVARRGTELFGPMDNVSPPYSPRGDNVSPPYSPRGDNVSPPYSPRGDNVSPLTPPEGTMSPPLTPPEGTRP